MLRNTLNDNKIFFIPYIILLLIITPFLITVNKGELHILINRYHSGFSDSLFALVTYMGDGLFMVFSALILLFFSLRHFLFLLTTFLSTGLVTQILKRVFFEDSLRPSQFLKDADLYIVEGVDLLSGRSFPSGHATTAFALFLCLALIIRNRYLKLVCFILACLTAFSRVYLSQHFLIDITAGSIVGTTGALAFYMLFYKKDRPWHAWKIQKAFNHEHRA